MCLFGVWIEQARETIARSIPAAVIQAAHFLFSASQWPMSRIAQLNAAGQRPSSNTRAPLTNVASPLVKPWGIRGPRYPQSQPYSTHGR